MIGIASSIGLLFKKGIPKKVSNAAMVVSGACTLYIGITGSLSGENVTIAEGIISAFCAGSMIGTNLMGDYKNESCGLFTGNPVCAHHLQSDSFESAITP